MSPTNLVHVELELDKAMITDAVKRLASKQGAEVVNTALRDAGASLVFRAANLMRKSLAPKHRFNVRASGAASHNISVDAPTGGKDGVVTYEINEGVGKGFHNYFIRSGFRGKKGKLPPEKPIKEWLASKGITLRDPENDKTGKTTRYIHSRSKKGKPYQRSLGQKDIAAAALFKIRRHIARYGSKYSHWNDLYPGGQGRFDYVAYVIRGNDGFSSALNRSKTYPIVAYLDWLSTGRKKVSKRDVAGGGQGKK